MTTSLLRSKTWHGLLAALVLTGAGAVQGAPEAINFSVATMTDPGSEGPEIQRPYVTVGKKKLIFRQPQNCRVSSAPEALSLLFTSPGMTGQITVANSPFTPRADFAKEVESYHETALATLPKEAEKTEFIGAKQKMYIGLQNNVAFEWTYSHFAHPTYRQIAYLNIDDEHQIMITIVCEEDSKEKINGFARRFFTTWYWLEEGGPAPAASGKEL